MSATSEAAERLSDWTEDDSDRVDQASEDRKGYWKYLEDNLREVASWPAWKRGGDER